MEIMSELYGSKISFIFFI